MPAHIGGQELPVSSYIKASTRPDPLNRPAPPDCDAFQMPEVLHHPQHAPIGLAVLTMPASRLQAQPVRSTISF